MPATRRSFCASMGLISFAGNATYPKAQNLRDVLEGARELEVEVGLAPDSSDRPLILITDYPPDAPGGGAVILRSLLAGAKGYVIKDVQLGELKKMVRSVYRGGSVLDPKVTGHVILAAKSASVSPGKPTMNDVRSTTSGIMAGVRSRPVTGGSPSSAGQKAPTWARTERPGGNRLARWRACRPTGCARGWRTTSVSIRSPSLRMRRSR